MIRKNQLMIESNHKIKTLSEAPDKKLVVENDRLGPKKLFTRPKKWKSFLKCMEVYGSVSKLKKINDAIAYSLWQLWQQQIAYFICYISYCIISCLLHLSRHFNMSKLHIHRPRLARIGLILQIKRKSMKMWWKWERGQTNKIWGVILFF
jgi:hypothetical protein